jgi:hypothetical protein
VSAKIGSVHLGEADAVVVAVRVEPSDRRQRFGRRPRLTLKVGANDSYRIRIESGFDQHNAPHRIDMNRGRTRRYLLNEVHALT